MADNDEESLIIKLENDLISTNPGSLVLDEDVHIWLLVGVRRFVHSGTSLDEGLNLKPAVGQNSLFTRRRVEARNQAIKNAYSLIPDAIQDEKKIGFFTDAIQRFEVLKWPRIQETGEIPDDRFMAALAEIFLPGAKVPATSRAIRQILGN